ncbi:hypothetical protein BH18THE2_BH18THE2_36640 [soil metagenome]
MKALGALLSESMLLTLLLDTRIDVSVAMKMTEIVVFILRVFLFLLVTISFYFRIYKNFVRYVNRGSDTTHQRKMVLDF